MSRNGIFNALLELGRSIEPKGAGSEWENCSRRLGDLVKGPHPQLFQIEPTEQASSRLGQMPKRQFGAIWLISHDFGKDQGLIPSEFTSDLIDKIEAKLSAPIHRQSLDGQVYAAFIDGTINKWSGDDDGITIIAVPISILVP